MRVGVDATCWTNLRGYGRHARALLGTLARIDRNAEYVFFMDAQPLNGSAPAHGEVRQVGTSVSTALAASANGHRSLRDMWRMSQALAAEDFDVLLFPTIYSYVPVLCRTKKVVMIHDVIAEKYPALTLPSLRARLFWKAKVALGRWQADAIVTVSEHSRRAIVDHFRLPPEHVHVVSEASDPVFRVLDKPEPTPRLRSLGLGDLDAEARTLVYVGGFSPHKNLELLVSVFSALAARDEFKDLRLVMVGEYRKEVFHSYAGTIRKQVERLGLRDRVCFTGFLPDEELVVLLNRATVLVLPSLLEGFGLPAVEAAACGCPVVATTASPLPALLGDAGLFVDPGDRWGWEHALQRVLSSPELRRRLREKGLAVASRLSWEDAARQLRDVLRKVAGR